MSTPNTAETGISEMVFAYARAYSTDQRIPCEENHEARKAARWKLEDAIASLEADKRRLDVLEEMLRGNRIVAENDETGAVCLFTIDDDGGDSDEWPSFREAADAEILRRSNTEVSPK